jgi:hypothetical protein
MEKNSEAEAQSEKLSEAVDLRFEYLELSKKVLTSSLEGLKMVNAFMNRVVAVTIVTVFVFSGAVFFLEKYAVVAVLLATAAPIGWLVIHQKKEWAKSTAMMNDCEALEEKMEGIACRYKELTGTELRGTFTAVEVQRVFGSSLKEYPSSLKA